MPFVSLLRRLFFRPDVVYSRYENQFQARTPAGRRFYLFMYLLPGLVVYAAINIPSLYEAGVRATGLTGRYYQYGWIAFITFGWHMVLPFLILRYHDKLSVRQTFEYLGMDRFDWRGCSYLQVIAFLLFTILTLPYMAYLQRPMYQWLDAAPLLRIPDYSIFKTAESLYGFPPVLLLLLFIGNFVGEELYFRGYLQKKTAFLGKHNVWVNGVLFAVYHLFQIPQTWPLVIPSMVFPLLMAARKNLYVVILFHLLVNLVWAPLIHFLLPFMP
ncbi:CPBP family intramembrane glutamic endopeptidase [Larkinella soli]|uniref:CPBP family intramembrane glutamic endopeptidase n=1 Tax=Larkinella soli TaxID=1770527 RepID=UPI000FFBC2F3|nr:CPBP family intramembrane glutamic endopeptidase [Larkinella soli]